MVRASRHIAAKGLITVILAVVLSVLGFAHRPAAPVENMRLAAYVAAGGAIEDLCELDGDARLHGAAHCDACRLVGAAALPDPGVLSLPGDLPLANTGTFPPPRSRAGFLRDPARAVRGPPWSRFS